MDAERPQAFTFKLMATNKVNNAISTRGYLRPRNPRMLEYAQKTSGLPLIQHTTVPFLRQK